MNLYVEAIRRAEHDERHARIVDARMATANDFEQALRMFDAQLLAKPREE